MIMNSIGKDAEVLPESLTLAIDEHIQEQVSLCAVLEKIADSLPEDFDPQMCLHAAKSIYPVFKGAHDFEENVLFPYLAKKDGDGERLQQIFNRLHAEHWEDESFGEEVSEALIDLVHGEQDNPEKLGYMLRGFFEGVKRHIAFEREHLIPLISK